MVEYNCNKKYKYQYRRNIMAVLLDNVVPWVRNIDEYKEMFLCNLGNSGKFIT